MCKYLLRGHIQRMHERYRTETGRGTLHLLQTSSHAQWFSTKAVLSKSSDARACDMMVSNSYIGSV